MPIFFPSSTLTSHDDHPSSRSSITPINQHRSHLLSQSPITYHRSLDHLLSRTCSFDSLLLTLAVAIVNRSSFGAAQLKLEDSEIFTIRPHP